MTSSFSSFPSTFSTFPDLDASAGSSKEPDNHREAKEKKRDRGHSPGRRRDKDKDRSKDRTHHKPRRETSSERKERRHSSKRVDEDETTSNLYFRDLRGDKYNIQYGCIHSADVPKYRLLHGGRYVLGLGPGLVAFRKDKGIEIGEKTRAKQRIDMSSSKAKSILSRPARRLALSNKSKYQEVDGVILFPPSKKKPQLDDDSYRSVLVKEKESPSDSESSSEDDTFSNDGETERVLSSYESTVKSLENELAANPAASDKWMALLEVSTSSIPATSKNATKARCEITLSILGRALEADPANRSDILLHLTYLSAGEQIWDRKKLNSVWEDALRGGGIELQMEWLEWKIREGKDGLDGIIECGRRVLDKLPHTTQGEICRIRVFSRLSAVIRDAGFSERAMAMFQAEAELIFRCPVDLKGRPLDSVFQELELYWDSEHARLGEPNAQGWSQWVSSSSMTHEGAPPSRPAPKVNIIDLDPYRQWAMEEEEYQKQSILPTRSDCDNADPYSTILFADIRHLLVPVTSPEAKMAFRLAWLSFLGLHVPGFSLSPSRQLDWDDRWNMQYLTRSSCLQAIFPSHSRQKLLLPDSVAGALIGKEPEYASPFGPVQHWPSSIQHPLDVLSGTTPRSGSLWSQASLSGIDHEVIRSVFSQLRLGRNDPEWDALALAFEAAIGTKSAIKLSKAFLAENSGSLLHWECHAKLERIRGKLDEARKIYQTVLIASKPQRSQREAALLWWSWAEMEWLADDEQATLHVILRSVELDGAVTGTALLRCKRALDEAIQQTKGPAAWKENEAWIKLRVLFELMTTHQVQSALAVADQELAFVVDEPARESLVTAILRLVCLNGRVLKRPFPIAFLRDRASGALNDYPSNSVMLGIFLEGEKGQGVWGKVRGLIGGNKAKDVARRIQEVWVAGWQQGRWVNELERTRGGLTAAINHERTKGSSIVWRIFIEFEIRANELKRAKNLLIRAISECPFSKELYLLAFGPLRGVFQRHELNTLADSMVERGLRLYQDIEDVLRGRNGESEDEGSEDAGTMDEIEERAAELRRLRPY